MSDCQHTLQRRLWRNRPNLTLRLLVTGLLAAGLSTAQGQTPVPAAAPAEAARSPSEERAALEQLRATTAALIEALVAQGLLPRDKADALLRQAAPGAAPAQAPAAAAAAATQWGAPAAAGARPVQRVPYLSDTARAELRDAVRGDLLEIGRQEGWAEAWRIPTWVRGITFGGDLRVRAQSELFDKGNLPADQYRLQNDLASTPAWAPDLLNTTVDRHRLTVRARLGLQTELGEDAIAGLRLSTGGTTGPTSASQTLGNQFNRYATTWDRAFLRWTPGVTWRLEAGRMAVPFSGGSLIWPEDLALDGAMVEYRKRGGGWQFNTRGGAFALQEFSVDKRDKWLVGLQAALTYDVDPLTEFNFALGVYDFQRIEGVRETLPPPTGAREGTVPYLTSSYPDSVRSKGNTLININDPTSTSRPTWGLASRFRPVHISTGMRWLAFAPLETGFSLDYLQNTGFDLADIQRRAGDSRVSLIAEKTKGFELRAFVGTQGTEQPGDWQLFGSIRQFERDAWPDGFTDTTWNGGGTNYKGWQLGGNYALDRSLRLGLRWTSTRNLDDGVIAPLVPTGTLSAAPFKLDVLQVELTSRF